MDLASSQGASNAAERDREAEHASNRDLGAEHRLSDPNRSERRFWVHATALLLLLLALVPFFDEGFIVIPDEGLYSAQAARLAEGEWRSPIVAPRIDPEAHYDAMFSEAIVGDELVFYHRHPAYPLLLSAFYQVGGFVGLMMSSLVGAWVAAVAGGRLARRLDPRFGLATLWILGAGSPLLFYSYRVAGHAPAAAACGLLVLSTVRWVEDRHNWSIVGAACAASALVFLRSEGVIVVAVLGAAIGVTAVRTLRPRLTVDLRTVGVGCLVWVVGAASYVLDSRLAGAVVDRTSVSSASVERSPDALAALWASLLRPWHRSALTATYTMAFIALALPLGAVALRVLPRRKLLPLALLVLAASAAIWRQFQFPGLVNGLLAAFPILPVGLIWIPSEHIKRRVGLVLAVTIGFATPAFLLTMYADGGATQWGGRFFTLLLPLAVPLAVAGLYRAAAQFSLRERTVAGISVLTVTAMMSLLSLRATYVIHDSQRRTIEAATAWTETVSSDDRGLLAIAQLHGDGESRMFWRQISRGAQILSLKALTPLPYVTAAAGREGYPGFILLADRPGLAELTMAEAFALTGWGVLESKDIEGTQWTLMRIGPAEGD